MKRRLGYAGFLVLGIFLGIIGTLSGLLYDATRRDEVVWQRVQNLPGGITTHAALGAPH